MRILALAVAAWLGAMGAAWGQAGAVPDPSKPDGGAVQHGAQPNPQEVRPPSPDGDSPSASVGTVIRKPERRILGLPVSAALVIGGVLVALVLAGVAIPSARRRERARRAGIHDAGRERSP